MKVWEVGFRDKDNIQKAGDHVLWSIKKFLAKNFDMALVKAQKEVKSLANKKIKVEIDYIKSLMKLD